MKRIGRYEVVELLGRGSMGAVYKAWDPMMDREVAIKTIQTDAMEGPRATEFRERFFCEAKAAGKLAHPGIVTVFDVSEHEGTPFLVMEYVPGQTLELMRKKQPLELDQVCDFGIQLAEALDYAHRCGVIHRDVKPANVLVTKDGRTKIADFGVARLTGSTVTLAGQLLGTPAFMAPEQFTGLSIDGRADLFAASVVIYWMATGDRPFTGDTAISVQYKVMQMDPIPPRQLNPAIPPNLEAIILKGIEKNPAKRYQSGAELAHELREVRAGRFFEPAVSVVETPKQSIMIETPYETTEVMLERLEEPVNVPAQQTMHFSTAKARPSVNWRPMAFSTMLALAFTWSAYTLMRPPQFMNEPNRLAEAMTAPETNVKPDLLPEPSTGMADAINKETTKETPLVVPVSGFKKWSAATNVDAAKPPAPVASEPAPAPSAVELQMKSVASPVTTPKHQQKLNPANSAELLISSLDLPDPLSVIVTSDSELLLSADSPSSQFASAVPLAEVRTLPPGEHKLQVNVMQGTRRVGRPQEITARFYAGQRRTLQISFLPEGERVGRDANRFTLTLK